MLHSLDWDKFFHFVIALHSSSTDFSTETLKDRLNAAHFSKIQIDRLTEFYDHGRRLLELA